jgi:hypothetical protein
MGKKEAFSMNFGIITFETNQKMLKNWRIKRNHSFPENVRGRKPLRNESMNVVFEMLE